MALTTKQLVLAAGSAVDFQMHTTLSDGRWQPDELIGHLAREKFGLAAITDHERPDTYQEIQRLAEKHHMPILPAAEMTTSWKGWTDVLCFGFRPGDTPLARLAEEVRARQSDYTRECYEDLKKKGVALPDDLAELNAIVALPSTAQPYALADLAIKSGFQTKSSSWWRVSQEMGYKLADSDIAAVVEAGHQSGAICLVAHPGRGGDNPVLDAAGLDEVRAYAPLDGFEAYYPLHKPEQVEMYLDYAKRHGLVVSAGSDSHSPEKPPIRYRAEQVRALLERVGVRVSA